MIRSLRKRHRRTFLILAVVLLVILLWALMSRPDWPRESETAPLPAAGATSTLDADSFDYVSLPVEYYF